MNEQQTKHFEEIIFKAVQQGKQETSDLVDMILHRIEPMIDNATNKYTEKYTNGKLRDLNIKIDAYIEQDSKDKERIAEALKLWKEEVTPQIEAVKEYRGWGKVSLGLLGFFAAIGTCIFMVINLLKLR